jgi:glycine/D-amino acid oxidase-like deaminating enzyme
VSWSLSLLAWGVHFVRNCTAPRFEHNSSALRTLSQLCVHSTQLMLDDIGASGFDDAALCKRPGTLLMYGSRAAYDAGVAKMRKLVTAGVASAEYLPGAADAVARFPWLSSWKGGAAVTADDARLPGAVLVNSDFSADAHRFCAAVASVCASPRSSDVPPVSFVHGERATAIVRAPHDRRVVQGVVLSDGRVLPCDAVVVCAGMHTRSLVKQWTGTPLPLQSMRGYSIDLSGCAGDVPSVAVADYSSGSLSFQMLPLEAGRVRIVGFAEFVPGCEPGEGSRG